MQVNEEQNIGGTVEDRKTGWGVEGNNENKLNEGLCEEHRKEFRVFLVGGCIVCWKDFEVDAARFRIKKQGEPKDQLLAETVVNSCLCVEPSYNCEESIAVHFNDLVGLFAGTLRDNRRDALEWAAQWIENSLKGEAHERTAEFGKNMAMTFRAATLPEPPNVPESAKRPISDHPAHGQASKTEVQK